MISAAGRVWRDYGLSLTLVVLFVASLLAQYIFQVLVEGDTVEAFFAELFANWQSEFLQLLTFVVLTSFLVHRGSHESKDGQDRMERKIDDLSSKVEYLYRGADGDDESGS